MGTGNAYGALRGKNMAALIVILWLLSFGCHSYEAASATTGENAEIPERMPVSIHDETVAKYAAYGLKTLRSLSDSGIYESLDLIRVISAASSKGVFHDNWFITLELTSPHLILDNGATSTVRDTIVMKSHDDGLLSFAIDKYPKMKPEAIDAYMQIKIEAHKARREALIQSYEREYKDTQLSALAAALSIDEGALLADIEMYPTRTLRKLQRLASEHANTDDSSRRIRDAIAQVIDARLDRLEAAEDAAGI